MSNYYKLLIFLYLILIKYIILLKIYLINIINNILLYMRSSYRFDNSNQNVSKTLLLP